jgi:Uma2 family endonuclease
MVTKPRATVQDLYQVPEKGKAELVEGELVQMSPTGGKPGRAGLKIASSLERYEEEHGGGYAIPDNVGFLVDLPDRDSFSPDAAWYTGQSVDMDFLEGAPAFAVEVRSKNDYGPAAESAIARKIKDYFAAGTQVVWDVDLLGDVVIKVYRKGSPSEPTLYRREDIADAEPAVPGWRFPIARLFT